MTIAMILLHRRLPATERYLLPPREITMKFARKTGVEDDLSPATKSSITLLSHFGYGAAAGAIYGGTEDRVKAAPILQGTVFGLIVWVVSYLGWLPAAGVLSSATEHPGRRNALMIVAHVVWGIVLGVFVSVMRQEAAQDTALSGAHVPHRDLAR
jgi:uncharacterized membrane protein YagU involved in acid resistance